MSFLGGWIYSFPRRLIDLVQEGIPYYDVINPLLRGAVGSDAAAVMDNDTNTASGAFTSTDYFVSEILLWLTPTLVAMALLLLTSCCICIGSCCYGCCRAKGNCGAKGHHTLHKCHNLQFSLSLVITIVLILALILGICIGFISNSNVSSSLQEFPDGVTSALENSFDYANDTASEALYALSDQFDVAISSVNADVRGIEAQLINPVLDILRPSFDIVSGNASQLLDSLDNTLDEVDRINDSLNQLEDQFVQLNTTLTTLSDMLSVFSMLCGGDMDCEEAVPTTPTANEIDGLLDTVETMEIIGDVGINDTREHLSNATMIFNNISSRISQQVDDFDISENNTVIPFISNVRAFRDSVNRDNEEGIYSPLSNSIALLDSLFQRYERYRFLTIAGLFGAFAALSLPFIFGTTLGTVGFRSGRQTFLRTSMSNYGAKTIFIGIIVNFILIGFLLLFSVPLYFIGTIVQKLCNDLAPPQYTFLTATVDNHSVWGGTTLFGLLLSGPLNTTANISVVGILDRCGQNQPLFQALQLDTVFNVSSYLSQLGGFPRDEVIEMLDIDGLADDAGDEVLPNATRQSIADLSLMLDPGSTEDLNQTVLDSSLETLSSELSDLAELFEMLNMTDEAAMVIDVRDDLVGTQLNDSLQAIEDMKRELNESLDSVSNMLQDTMFQAEGFLTLFDMFQNSTIDILLQEGTAFVDQLGGYFDAYTSYLANNVETELGQCDRVPEAYRQLYTSLCGRLLDGINAMWLGIIWCVCGCLALIIAGTWIAIFFWRWSLDGYELYEEGGTGETPSSEILYDSYKGTRHFPVPTYVLPAPMDLPSTSLSHLSTKQAPSASKRKPKAGPHHHQPLPTPVSAAAVPGAAVTYPVATPMVPVVMVVPSPSPPTSGEQPEPSSQPQPPHAARSRAHSIPASSPSNQPPKPRPYSPSSASFPPSQIQSRTLLKTPSPTPSEALPYQPASTGVPGQPLLYTPATLQPPSQPPTPGHSRSYSTPPMVLQYSLAPAMMPAQHTAPSSSTTTPHPVPGHGRARSNSSPAVGLHSLQQPPAPSHPTQYYPAYPPAYSPAMVPSSPAFLPLPYAPVMMPAPSYASPSPSQPLYAYTTSGELVQLATAPTTNPSRPREDSLSSSDTNPLPSGFRRSTMASMRRTLLLRKTTVSNPGFRRATAGDTLQRMTTLSNASIRRLNVNRRHRSSVRGTPDPRTSSRDILQMRQ